MEPIWPPKLLKTTYNLYRANIPEDNLFAHKNGLAVCVGLKSKIYSQNLYLIIGYRYMGGRRGGGGGVKNKVLLKVHETL